MNDRFRRAWLGRAALLVVLLGLPAPATAQQPPEGAAPAPGFAVALVAGQASETPTQVLEITLADAVELALRHNLQVRIASLNPDLQEEQIRSARAQFDPVFTFNMPQTFSRSTTPSSRLLKNGLGASFWAGSSRSR